jgi:hypothetical protein
MLWGKDQISDFTSTLGNTLTSNQVSAALAFNEPQQSGQSNLSPEDGASMWKEYIEPLKAKGLRLGSPAPSSAPNGKTWLQDFLTACNGGCTVDFIALHWYATNTTEFKRYLTDFHDTFQRPLWITEWACQNFAGGPQCKDDEVPVFLRETQGFMDSVDWVERYSYFGAMKEMQGVNEANRLMDKKGKITDLGKQYIGMKSGGSGNGDDGDGDGVTVGNAALSLRDGARQFAILSTVAGVASIIALTM